MGCVPAGDRPGLDTRVEGDRRPHPLAGGVPRRHSGIRWPRPRQFARTPPSTVAIGPPARGAAGSHARPCRSELWGVRATGAGDVPCSPVRTGSASGRHPAVRRPAREAHACRRLPGERGRGRVAGGQHARPAVGRGDCRHHRAPPIGKWQVCRAHLRRDLQTMISAARTARSEALAPEQNLPRGRGHAVGVVHDRPRKGTVNPVELGGDTRPGRYSRHGADHGEERPTTFLHQSAECSGFRVTE
jgi:hypothetical protein